MKTSNFKKVLALVLALAMVLSVCTMSFSVSAETEAADLSYYVINDATDDNGWEGHNTVATRVFNDRNVYRVTAINTASAAQFSVKSYIDTLTVDDFANINTVSMYVNNTTGETLQFAYDYYKWEGSGETFNDWRARLSNGYVYLVAANKAVILPYKTDTYGNVKIPAGFEGYLIYDFSNSANYGNASSHKDGDLGPSVDWIKSKSFQGMSMFVKNTENMLTTPWYFGEVAVSTKTVEELAKYLTGDEIVGYNFNMANSRNMDANESVIFWGARYANHSTDDNGARPEVVDYDDSLDGTGLKSTLVSVSGESTGNIIIRDSFFETRKTDLPFAIDKAVGIKYDVTTQGTHGISLCIAGQDNELNGTYYYVYEDGTVMYGHDIPANFKGTVYFIFDEKAVNGTTTWAGFINSAAKRCNFTIYTSDMMALADSSITFGGFSFIYDAEPVETAFAAPEAKNPVIFDGNEYPMRYVDGWEPASYDNNWTILGGKEMTAVYKGTSTRNWLYFNDGGKAYEGALDAANVKGLSFKLKTPADGATTLTMGMGGDDKRRFYGTMYAIDIYGNIVSSFTADGTTRGEVKLPSGFEGIIVMDAAGTYFSTNYSGGLMSFADFYVANQFSGIHLVVTKTGNYVVGETTYVYDDLTVIYDTVEDYIADYQASCPEAESYTIFNGSDIPKVWNALNKTSANSVDGKWSLDNSEGKIVATCNNTEYAEGKNGQTYLPFNNQNQHISFYFDVSKVTGLSFDFKVPDDGNDHIIGIEMGTQNNRQCYHGIIKAINKDGTVAFSRGQNYGGDGSYRFTLPAGFDGKIILADELNGSYGNYTLGWWPWQKNVTTFAEYYAYEWTTESVGKNANQFKGLLFYVSPTGENTYEEGTTFEYDNLRAICEDADTYIAKVQSEYAAAAKAKAEADAHKDGYIVNDLSGANGNTASIYTNGNTNNVDVDYSYSFKTFSTCAYITFNKSHPNSAERAHNMKVNNTAGLDLTKIAGFKYRIEITNPDNVGVSWYYKVNRDDHKLKGLTIYLISDDGAVTKFRDSVTLKTAFSGYVVVLIDDGNVVAPNWSDTASVTWADWVNTMGFTAICPYFSATVTPQMTEAVTNPETGAVITPATLTGGYANFAMKYDNLAVIYDDVDILKPVDEQLDTEKYYTNFTAVDKTAFGEYSSLVADYVGKHKSHEGSGIYLATLTTTPNGDPAYIFTHKGNEHTTTGAYEMHLTSKSTLSKEEIISKEAAVYYVKIEGGQIPLWLYFGSQYPVQTSYIAYDVNTTETMMLTGNKTFTDGFEGYIIVPLKNAIVGKTGAEMSFKDYVTNVGFKEMYYQMWHSSTTATTFTLGAYQFVDSISSFLEEIGAETTPGDVNNDTEVDVRDIIRLKKYNTDPKTLLAYQNADIDGNGLIETASELVNARKQNLGVKYEATEKDDSLVKYPETMVGIYHHTYGDWDSKYANIIAEDNIVNTYITTDYYELKEIGANGDAAWFQLFKDISGEYVFQKLNDEGKKVYDSDSLVINGAYMDALDAKIQKMKDLGVWNAVIGFHSEEILMSQVMTNEQFAIWTKYLAETYGKRFFACLSAYENKGGTHKYNDEKVEVIVPRADYETYQYVTDIGFDDYDELYPNIKSALEGLMTNVALCKDGETVMDRSDMKYWLFPTAFTGCATINSELKDEEDNEIKGTTSNGNGKPSADDATIAAYIADYDLVFSEIPEAQRGGLMFYTWTTWSSSYGLEDLIEDYGYTLTRDALIDLATKYVK